MPVERIRAHSLPYGNESEAESIIEVTWGRTGSPVHIATKCVRRDDGTDYVLPLEPIEVPMTMTSQGLSSEVVELVELEGSPVRSGWYADFDRTALNQLIRVLRRARNAEYEADE
jgi:hypothetical protein